MQDKKISKTEITVSQSDRPSPWRITLAVASKRKGSGFSTLPLLYGFAAVIAIGTLLLMLPVSSQTHEFTPTLTALFTSTSAVCVTGLVVVDTGTYWSFFGQAVILVLFQFGGLGFMTSATALLLVLGRRIGLRQRMLLSEALSLRGTGGLVRLVKWIILFTFIAEGAGVLVLFVRFVGHAPLPTALWQAIFHSVSAFTNAGFDLFGNFKSITGFQQDAPVLLTIAVLVILGGISFPVIMDTIKARRFSKLTLNSKIVLTTTAILLSIGTVFYLIAESGNPATLGPLSLPYKLLNAFFHAVTPRSAGFSTISVGAMRYYSLFFTMVLMFIGGATASGAGGIKVSTLGLLIITVISTIRGHAQPRAFGRELHVQQIYRALAIVIIYLLIVAIAIILLTITEDFDFLRVSFETVSAAGTVGLSMGITPMLSTAGRLIVTVLMFSGRLGPLTLAVSLLEREHSSRYHFPQEIVSLG